MSKRPTWYRLRLLICWLVGHPWADEYGNPARDRHFTGTYCARCWREF